MTKLQEQYITAAMEALKSRNVIFTAIKKRMEDNKGKYRGHVDVPQFTFKGEKPWNPVQNPENTNSGGVPGRVNLPNNGQSQRPKQAGGTGVILLTAGIIGAIAYGTKSFAKNRAV